ncbi:MAG: hypothetical protein WCT39_01840, partial [Candidatus Margulisiibacteriota bacterium]
NNVEIEHNRGLLYYAYLGALNSWSSDKRTGKTLSKQQLVEYAFMLMKVELELQKPIDDQERIPLARLAATKARQFAIDNDLKVNMGEHMLSLLNNYEKLEPDAAWLAALRRWIPMYFVLKSIFGQVNGGQPTSFTGRNFDTEVNAIITDLSPDRKTVIQKEFESTKQLGSRSYNQLRQSFNMRFPT